MWLIAKIFLLLLIKTSLADYEFEGDIQYNKPYLFVSLGSNCWQAQALRQKAHSLRDAAFPFDWLLTPDTDKLIQCLDEEFEHFNDQSCFMRDGSTTDVSNFYYNFKFTHDWPYSGNLINPMTHYGQLEFIKQKYQRRIARFNNLKHFKGKIFFMRCFELDSNYGTKVGWNEHNARNLNEALKRFFPEVDFTLVIISRAGCELSEIGNIDGIKEYKVYDLTNWDEYYTIFEDILSNFSSKIY